MAEATVDTKAQVLYWDAGPPGYRWMQLASQQMFAQNVAAPLFTRGMALVGVAMYDATIAAWDSKFAWHRPSPSAIDSTIHPLVTLPNIPVYPSEHAVVAGAAAVVMAYLFPAMAETYTDLAEEAARSRGRHIAPEPKSIRDSSPLAEILNRYEKHLRSERGLVTSTVVNYLPFARKFLVERFPKGPLLLPQLRSSDISAFVLRHAQTKFAEGSS